MRRPSPSVHWDEGMMLRPQHLQSFGRYVENMAAGVMSCSRPYAWGVRKLEIVASALEIRQIDIKSAQVVFQDGTPFEIPGSCRLAPQSFEESHISPGRRLEVFLAIPAISETLPLVGSKDSQCRYQAVSEKVVDENSAANPREIKLRMFNARILLSGESQVGYTVIKIAEIERQSPTSPLPVISRGYVPPLLDVTACEALGDRLRRVSDGLKSKSRAIARAIPSVVKLESVGQGDMAKFLMLKTLNTYANLIEEVSTTEGVHPFDVYLRLVEVAGALSIFGDADRDSPTLDRYHHADCAKAFGTVCDYIAERLKLMFKQNYDHRVFHPSSERKGLYEAELPVEWLGPDWEIYLAVDRLGSDVAASSRSTKIDPSLVSLPNEIKLVGQAGRENVFRGLIVGLPLVPLPGTPPALPAMTGTRFWRVDHESATEESRRLLRRSTHMTLWGPSVDLSSFEFKLFAATTK